ncbi:MAG TPA: ATP-binding protein [Phycisphaerae bacterium]|nr:ATP-binding protein [Phycisphaerae bacterium]
MSFPHRSRWEQGWRRGVRVELMPFNPRPLPHRVVIPSDLHAARQVEEDLLEIVQERGYPQESAFAIRLALEEALVNAHKHGNRCDPNRRITVTYDIDDRRVVIRVRDEGAGFAPICVPDPTLPERLSLPTGRGIMLMRAYVDDLAYNQTGNEVQLIKEKRPCPDRPPLSR